MSGTETPVEWVEAVTKQTCSPLGRKVAWILDGMFFGIHHAGNGVGKADWTNEGWIRVVVDAAVFSTFDPCGLALLVILAHDACVRVQIGPCGPHRLEIVFHRREREGIFSRRHPTIERAITIMRSSYGVQEGPLTDESIQAVWAARERMGEVPR